MVFRGIYMRILANQQLLEVFRKGQPNNRGGGTNKTAFRVGSRQQSGVWRGALLAFMVIYSSSPRVGRGRARDKVLGG